MDDQDIADDRESNHGDDPDSEAEVDQELMAAISHLQNGDIYEKDDGLYAIYWQLRSKNTPIKEVRLTDFQVQIVAASVNTLEDHPQVFIMACKNSKNQEFEVPITKTLLGNYTDFKRTVKEWGKSTGLFMNDIKIPKTRLLLWIMDKVEAYEQGPNKKGAILLRSPGYVQLEWNGHLERVYAASRNCLVPTNANNVDPEIADMKIYWIGKGVPQELHIAEDIQVGREFFDHACKYSANNVGAFCLLLGYAQLSMHFGDLQSSGKDLHVPVVQVIGEAETGKSEMMRNVLALFPRLVQKDGTQSQEASPVSMSESVLNLEVSKVKPFTALDPAPQWNVNNFVDRFYEGRIAVNHANSNHVDNEAISSGVVFVWKNESRMLPNQTLSAMTKSVTLLASRDPSFDNIGTENAKKRCQELRQDPAISGLFATCVQALDIDDLIKTKNSLQKSYKNNTALDSSISNRVLDCYALVHASTILWLKKLGFCNDDDLIAQVNTYVKEVTVPWALSRIVAEVPKRKQVEGDAILGLAHELKNLPPTEFFCNISIKEIENEAHLCITMGLMSRLLKQERVLFTGPKGMRSRFMIPGSEEILSHSSSMLKRKLCQGIAIRELPDTYQKALVSRLKEFFPNIDLSDDQRNIVRALEKCVDSCGNTLNSVELSLEATVQKIFPTLTSENQKKVLDLANQLQREQNGQDGPEKPEDEESDQATDQTDSIDPIAEKIASEDGLQLLDEPKVKVPRVEPKKNTKKTEKRAVKTPRKRGCKKLA